MAIDATFWVAVSFIIFFGGLVYLKIPQKINNVLTKLISDIKNEIDESEKLRSEAKVLLDKAQDKLNAAQKQFPNLLLGFALAEATGLFGLVVALIILFAF